MRNNKDSILRVMLILVILFSIVSFDSVSRADQSNTTGYVGALLGLGTVNNSGGTNFTYGLGAGYKFMPDWSAGLDYTYNTYTVPSPLTANLSMILANVRYYFSSPQGLFAGLKLGSGSVSISGAGASVSTSNFTWGPTVGYNYFFNGNWSAGGEANLLWVNNTSPGVSVFQILASGKYWF